MNQPILSIRVLNCFPVLLWQQLWCCCYNTISYPHNSKHKEEGYKLQGKKKNGPANRVEHRKITQQRHSFKVFIMDFTAA